MHTLLIKLEKDHQNLLKILDLLTAQMEAFFAGKESNFDLKLELLDYMTAYADLAHHPVENLIFKLAAGKAGAEKAEQLNKLEAQHEQLSQLTRSFPRPWIRSCRVASCHGMSWSTRVASSCRCSASTWTRRSGRRFR